MTNCTCHPGHTCTSVESCAAARRAEFGDVAGYEKRIREALAAGPTAGPWISHQGQNQMAHPGTTVHHGRGWGVYSDADEHGPDGVDAAYIAACNPTAIRALLADLDVMRGLLLEARETIDTLPGYPKGADLCDRIDAALSEAKAGGWKSMESAPRDGSMFLCWVEAMRYGETDDGQQYQQDASEVDFCRWCACDESPNGGYFDNMAGQIADLQHVTKWQPIPAPPAQRGEG